MGVKTIQEIHVSWGDYSYRYRVGNYLDIDGWGKISKIQYNQYETLESGKMTYDIYGWNLSTGEPIEQVAKRLIDLPVELTYTPT